VRLPSRRLLGTTLAATLKPLRRAAAKTRKPGPSNRCSGGPGPRLRRPARQPLGCQGCPASEPEEAPPRAGQGPCASRCRVCRDPADDPKAPARKPILARFSGRIGPGRLSTTRRDGAVVGRRPSTDFVDTGRRGRHRLQGRMPLLQPGREVASTLWVPGQADDLFEQMGASKQAAGPASTPAFRFCKGPESGPPSEMAPAWVESTASEVLYGGRTMVDSSEDQKFRLYQVNAWSRHFSFQGLPVKILPPNFFTHDVLQW